MSKKCSCGKKHKVIHTTPKPIKKDPNYFWLAMLYIGKALWWSFMQICKMGRTIANKYEGAEPKGEVLRRRDKDIRTKQ